MAYAKEVQIIKGDILTNPTQFNGTRERTLYGLLTKHYGSLDYYQPLNYIPTNAALQCTAGGSGYIRFSPNGRYVLYNSTQTQNSSSTGLCILDLELNTQTNINTVGTSFTVCFSTDSTTALISSGTAPFMYSIDLVNKVARGTITGGPTLTSLSMKAAAYGSLIYFIHRGTGSTGELYSYNPATNSCTLLVTHAFQFAHIAIDTIGYCYLPNGSSGAGRGLNVYDLNSIGTTPAMNTALTTFFGTIANNENAVVSSNGIYFCGQGGLLRAAKINYGANVTATTFTNISPSVNVALFNSGASEIKHVNNNIFFNSSATAIAPQYQPQLLICDVNGYTTGNLTASICPGANTSIHAFDIQPAFTKRKLAGTVLDASLAPVDREVIVIARDTGRLLATTTSSSVDGTFLIELYTTSPVIVLAKGEGAEVTKLVDNVVPVAP
jgi:hypothetical protein